MTNRITYLTVMLPEPFLLTGLDEAVPAGSYEVTIEEELLGNLMYPVYRRVASTIYVPRLPGRVGVGQVIEVTAAELNMLVGNSSQVAT